MESTARTPFSGSSDLDTYAASVVTALTNKPRSTFGLARELNRLSHAYDRNVLQEEHPAPPVSSADLVLAIIVVVPEPSWFYC